MRDVRRLRRGVRRVLARPWADHAVGMATEALYVVALGAVALVIAIAATVLAR